MNKRNFSLERRATLVALSAWATQLAGCGGGGGGFAGLSSGGTGSFTSGTVTGLGSIIVNGIRYADDQAVVTDRDDGSSTASPKVGMVVAVQGTAVTPAATANGLASATASRISYGSEWQGPVGAVAASSFTLLGLTVDVLATTVFEGAATSLAQLVAGQFAEVHGYLDTTSGRLQATRVDSAATAPAGYRLSGVVSALDTTARTFSIGAVRLAYDASLSLPLGWANGLPVRVRTGGTALAGGAWPVTRVQASNAASAGVSAGEGAEAEVQGVVTAYTALAQFSVNGLVVDASAATVSGTVAAGVYVEVEGQVSQGGIRASKVKVKAKSEIEAQSFEFVGLFSQLDVSQKTFVLKGYTFAYTTATQFSGIDFSRNPAPVRVQVKATQNAAGGWVASEIEKDS